MIERPPAPLRNAADLIRVARATPWLRRAMETVRSLDLDAWAIGAGAIRDVVWNALDGCETPGPAGDLDVVYFDPHDDDGRREAAFQRRLRELDPTLPWDLTNQAAVHRWFPAHFGHPVPPLVSLDDAVASWPEYATCVALTIDRTGAWRVIAPHGLDDLFGRVVRRNPVRVSVATYRQRVAEKRYAERWPDVTIIDP